MPNIPTHHPRIILDCDDTLHNGSRKNQALVEALQFLQIQNVAMGTSYAADQIALFAIEGSTRDQLIGWLTTCNLTTDYVVVLDSDIFDEPGLMGSYYRKKLQPAEKIAITMHGANPNIVPDAIKVTVPTIAALINEEDTIWRELKNPLYETLESLAADTITEEQRNAGELLRNQLHSQLKIKAKKDDLAIPALSADRNYRGGKETMLVYLVDRDKEASDFVMLDDKKQVIETVNRMNQGDLHPNAKGRMHGVHVDMENPNQDRNYYIRHIIQGYKPAHLLTTIEKFKVQIPYALKKKLTNVVKNPALCSPEQLKLLARLVLMYLNPRDYINIKELAAEIAKQDNKQEWIALFNEAKEFSIQEYFYQLAKQYFDPASANKDNLSTAEARTQLKDKIQATRSDQQQYSFLYEKENASRLTALKSCYQAKDTITCGLRSGMMALIDNPNAVDLMEFLVFVNNISFDESGTRQSIKKDLIAILENAKNKGKYLSAENYLRYLTQLDSLATQFGAEEGKEFKRLMQETLAENFIQQHSDISQIKNAKNLFLIRFKKTYEDIRDQGNNQFSEKYLALMLNQAENTAIDNQRYILELIARLHLAQADITNIGNILSILELLKTLNAPDMFDIRYYANVVLNKEVFNKPNASSKLFTEIAKKYQSIADEDNSEKIYEICKNHFDYNTKNILLHNALDALQKQEQDNQANKAHNRKTAIHLTLLALGAFNSEQAKSLLENISQNSILPTTVFPAIVVLADTNLQKALALLKVIINGEIKLDESTPLNFDAQCFNEANITKEDLMTNLRLWAQKDSSPNDAEIVAVAEAMHLILNPQDLNNAFRLSSIVEKRAKFALKDPLTAQLRGLEQKVFEMKMGDDPIASAKAALPFLADLIEKENDPQKKQGLTMVHTRAKKILYDETRSDETRGLASQVVLRTVQLVVNPAHKDNTTALQSMLDKKQHRLSLGDKMLRGVALVLAAVTGVGLVFAIPFGLSTYKKHTKSELLKATEAFIKPPPVA